MRPVFSPGELIWHSEVADGRPWLRYPVRVVQDTGDELAVFLARGTQMMFFGPAGRRPEHPWSSLGDRWLSQGVLRIHPVGRRHCVEAHWDEAGALLYWYVNFQSLLRRAEWGYETLDQELDLVISPSLDQITVKDADGFLKLVRAGDLPQTEAAGILVEAAALIERIGRADPWWDLGWADWVPPAQWQAGPRQADLSPAGPGGPALTHSQGVQQ